MLSTKVGLLGKSAPKIDKMMFIDGDVDKDGVDDVDEDVVEEVVFNLVRPCSAFRSPFQVVGGGLG